MARSSATLALVPPPRLRDVIELTKPITWFPPIWAFMCGVVSSGEPWGPRLPFIMLGMLLTGPLVCGTSQVVNDWFDRHVDAINEPDRPIPSGRIGGTWGLRIAIVGSLISLGASALAGPWVVGATCLALASAWAYSAPPFRAKMSGIWGPGLVAISYEGLTWFTGASVMSGGLPPAPVLAVLILYSVGAHGIMTLNDFKAVEGDRAMGIRSLPVTIGVRSAARVACWVMAVPQVAVIAILFRFGHVGAGAIVVALLAGQLALMPRLIADPVGKAPWYNATGTTLSVLGMLASALGLGGVLPI